jgi:hypothetical protein
LIPSTGVFSPGAKTIPRLSPNECAGSVLIIRVFLPCSAAQIAELEAHVVFPTPPFPPNITIFKCNKISFSSILNPFLFTYFSSKLYTKKKFLKIEHFNY